MLFKFNKFWKMLLALIGSLIIYNFFGFEMTVITLLTLLFFKNAKNTTHLL
tara:strand:+ start:713 stop:865 length:153 start_codon:yes stop_codon:yes gene_type:complete